MIYFYSLSCHACKRMDSTFMDKTVEEYANARFVNYKVDVLSLADGGIDIAQKLGIESYPAVMFYSVDGRPIYEVDAYISSENLIGNMKTEWENAQKGAEWCATHNNHWVPKKQAKADFCEITYPANFKFDANELNQEIANEMKGVKTTKPNTADQMYAARGDNMVAKTIDKPAAVPQATKSKVPTYSETVARTTATTTETDAFANYDISKFPSAKYAVQILATNDKAALAKKIQALEAAGEKDILTAKAIVNGKSVYKLMLGKFDNRIAAQKKLGELGEGFIMGLSTLR